MNSTSDSRPRRVLIVGGVAGGASCATRLRRLDATAQITLIERGPHVSFANCGLPYYVGDVIKDREDLLVATPKLLEERFGLRVRVRHEATRIDREARTLTLKNLQTGESVDEPYDVLVLSPGAKPIRPPLSGLDHESVFTVRSIPDVDAIRDWIGRHNARRATVVGAGFIGLEMVENLVERGLQVTVVERADQVLPPMDPEVVHPLEKTLETLGVRLVLGDGLSGVEATGSETVVVTQAGKRLPSDLVILAIGVRPEVGLAREAGLEIGERGGILVDETMRTADPAIFAIGDAVQVRDVITHDPVVIPLAGPANRQGRIVADVIAGRDVRYRGTQGTFVVQVFDRTLAGTGASEKTLTRAGRSYAKAYLHPSSHAGYYPGAVPMDLKVLFDPDTGRVLGGQAIGSEGVTRRIDVLAMLIQLGGTVFDLEEGEFCYSPQHGSAKDPLNMAGFIGANHVRGVSPLVQWEDVRAALEEKRDVTLLDVRSTDEVTHQPGPPSVNIPLNQLRDRLEEIPRDRPVWTFCASGQRSHNATAMLRDLGFDASNISGGVKTEVTEEPMRND